MHLFELLLESKLKQASSLSPSLPPSLSSLSLSLASLSLPLSLLLSLHVPMLPLVSPPFLSDLWQLTEESCPPLPSEVADPHREMEMPHHCLSARCAFSFSSPSITLCIYEHRHQECWHHKLTCVLSLKLSSDTVTGSGRYCKGYAENRTCCNFISKSINYGRPEHQTTLWKETETKSLPLYMQMTAQPLTSTECYWLWSGSRHFTPTKDYTPD